MSGKAVTLFSLFVISLFNSKVDSFLLPDLDISLGNFSTYTLPEPGFLASLVYNEDADLTFPKLTQKYGYQSESHTVTTEDGYILTLFRIPKGKKCSGEVKSRPVVLMHGLMDTSDTFIIATPDVALAYLLADSCYDVWCPNHRGNRYSREHVTLDTTQTQYWNFTYDQHGMFDLPAIIDHVLEVTEQTNLDYIGHSQGTTDFFVLTSTKPEYNEKFNVAICLAPVAWMKHIFSPILQIISKLTPELKAYFDFTGQKETFGVNTIPSKFLEYVCLFVPETICGSMAFLESGPINISRTTLSAAYGHYPDSTSTNNLAHFGQAINVDKFRHYDYGKTKTNTAVYGKADPPEYDVTKVSAKVALVRGASDWLVAETDVDKLKSLLPNVVDYYVMPDPQWSHVDFVWGKGIPDVLFPKIGHYLNTYE